MKKKGLIIATIVMVLVLAVSLTTATYAWFTLSDVTKIDASKRPVNTIFQNPPFGSQKRADKGQDLNFVKKAMEFSPDVLYSFHMASTEEFLMDFYENNNLNITHLFRYEFPIPKIYEFHNKEKQIVDVIVIRAEL